MTPADLLAFGLRSRAAGRSRVRIDDVWLVFTEVRPDDARAADARQRLAELIRQAEWAGLIKPSASTDRMFPVPLPRFVDIVSREPPRQPAKRSPWLPQLDWAAQLRLTPVQLDVLDRVNRWLRDGGDVRPIVPAEERSIELFDDEKAIANRVGGATTLWSTGRLGPDLLRYENVPIPFPYRQVGSGDRLLMVENTGAFRTCSKLLAAGGGHPYFAVAFGQGAWAPKTIPAALELPAPVGAVDYWGDLDVRGLVITQEVIDAAVSIGLIAQAHPRLWRLMVAGRPVRHPEAPRSFEEAVLNVLPADIRTRAYEVLSARMRIPQERLGYEQLLAVEDWWNPTVG